MDKVWTIAEYDALTKKIFDSALEVHKEFGPGLLESIYSCAFVKELRVRNLKVETQVLVPLHYKGENLEKQFFIDILVENEIVIEIKAIEGILPVHEAQLLTYLKLSGKKLGFLINFNVTLLKQGFKRRVNKFPEEDHSAA
jgi:GxxExxY protein